MFSIYENLLEQNRDIIDLKNLFSSKEGLDTGTLNYNEFRNSIQFFYKEISPQALTALTEEFKIESRSPTTHRINYSEFLKKLDIFKRTYIAIQGLLLRIFEAFEAGKTDLFDSFKIIDANNNGYIERKDFENAMYRSKITIDQQLISDLILLLDSNDDGKINYVEFEMLFRKYAKKKGKNIEDIKKSTFYQGN